MPDPEPFAAPFAQCQLLSDPENARQALLTVRIGLSKKGATYRLDLGQVERLCDAARLIMAAATKKL